MTPEESWLELFPKLSPEKVLEQFLPLLGQAWETKKAMFTATDGEDTITNTLIADIIKQVRQRGDIAWSVQAQRPILAERDDGAGEIIGRCDLIIELVGNREYIHECKRLWPESKSRTFTKAARLYVQQGVLRFLQPSEKHPTAHPQYDAWQGFAGMIGYVMDGRVPEACNAVQSATQKYAPPLHITSPCPSTHLAEGSLHFRSSHQDCAGQAVCMHHLFLELSAKAH